MSENYIGTSPGGGWGNQFFISLFGRVWARRHHQTWINTGQPFPGTHLYGWPADTLPRQPPVPMRRLEETAVDLYDDYEKTCGHKARNYDDTEIDGYLQCNTRRHAADRAWIQHELFKLTPAVAALLDPFVDAVRARGQTVIALQLRHGDFGWGPFPIAPNAWYLGWLQANWQRFVSPVLYIATNAPDRAREDFAAFKPMFRSDIPHAFAPGFKLTLSPPHDNVDYFPDFHILTQADVALISNSTFGVAASLLNTRPGAEFHRPDFWQGGMKAMDPWNTWPWEHWHQAGRPGTPPPPERDIDYDRAMKGATRDFFSLGLKHSNPYPDTRHCCEAALQAARA